MKHILLIIASVLSSLNAQIEIRTIPVTTYDLVYDSLTRRIYASIPSSNGSNGNSIGIIDPALGTLDTTIFMGSEPTVMAISDDGQFIYTGFNGSSTVRRFHVPTRTAGLQFSLGSSPFTGAYYVEDIEVMPNHPSTVAIARKNKGFSPRHEGVVIYDGNVKRPNTTPFHTGSNRIEFTSENTLIGYNNETTEFGIRNMSVDSSGVQVVSVTPNILSNFYMDFIVQGNYLYSTDGTVVDISGVPFVLGQCSGVNGPVMFDPYYGRVCYGSSDFSGNIFLKRYDPSTFLIVDSLPIYQATGAVKSLITCGKDCYALNTSDGKVIIISSTSLSVSDPNSGEYFSIFPNPATDYLQIRSDAGILEFKMLDLNGRIVKVPVPYSGAVYLGDLGAGVYVARIRTTDHRVISQKIVKN